MAAEVTRETLAAILAADAAGYSRLMDADARATVAALDTAREVFRRHIDAQHGRLVDMAGDSVLALFESATAAVSAGLAIQRELALLPEVFATDERMAFRIGVHLGEVVEKGDGTVYGEGVNAAARLEGLAEPGWVLVSEAVYAAVRGRLVARFDDLGSRAVKNLAAPLRAWRVSEETRALKAHTASGGALHAGAARPRAAAGRLRSDTRRVLPHLLLEGLFALLPLVVLGAFWPGAGAPHPATFAASPAWPMTACFLYGLGLARLWSAMRGAGRVRERHEGTAAMLVALLPLAGVIASVVLIGRLVSQPAGAATLTLSIVNLALALACFAVFGGYGMRDNAAAGPGSPP